MADFYYFMLFEEKNVWDNKSGLKITKAKITRNRKIRLFFSNLK
jgi:hypothetical protein